MPTKPADITIPPWPPGETAWKWLCGPWPVALLFSGFFLVGLTAAGQKSPTFDEPIHLTGGYTYWAYNDYRLHTDNGNWSQRWAALPVWSSGYVFPSVNDPDWTTGNMWGLSHNFLFQRGNNADAMIRLGRYMQAVLAGLMALVVYRWSTELFGEIGGLIALTVCVSSPIIYGFGFFVTSDMGVTLFLVASTWGVWKLLHRVTPQTLALTGLALSGAALSKFSGLAILPISLVLVCARLANPAPWTVVWRGTHEVSGRIRQMLLMLGLGAVLIIFVSLMIWTSFGFRYSMYGAADVDKAQMQRSWELIDEGSGVVPKVVGFARNWRLLPEGYLFGFSYIRAAIKAHDSFLNGQFNKTGFKSYFFYCLALKTPLTTFVLLLLGAAAVGAGRGRTSSDKSSPPLVRLGLYDLIPLLAMGSIFLAFAIASNMNVGHRHIMPIYPAMFVFAGAAGLWFRPDAAAAGTSAEREEASASSSSVMPARRTTQAARAVILGTMAFAIAHTLWIWPNYQSFFNVFGGGYRHGYRHLVDASTDWGQDLRGLIQWLAAHPGDGADPNRVFVSYQGTADVRYYGLKARMLPPIFTGPQEDFPYTGGVYCISATKLQSVKTPYPGHWNKEYEELYQSLRPVSDLWLKVRNDPAARAALTQQVGAEKLRSAIFNFENLRFGRLCAFLRVREPDDNVGGSILLFRLSDDDVKRILEGPPPAEMLERPET